MPRFPHSAWMLVKREWVIGNLNGKFSSLIFDNTDKSFFRAAIINILTFFHFLRADFFFKTLLNWSLFISFWNFSLKSRRNVLARCFYPQYERTRNITKSSSMINIREFQKCSSPSLDTTVETLLSRDQPLFDQSPGKIVSYKLQLKLPRSLFNGVHGQLFAVPRVLLFCFIR